MKILSIDTASNICGVSILEDTNLLCKLDTDTGRTHSENLMPMIRQAFAETNLSLKDIGLIVCDKGPGSFTGIRIGLATAKAFHDSLSIPCIGISSLETLAYNTQNDKPESEYICSIMDCKNNNFYFALYEKKNNCFETLIEPQAESIIGTLAILKSYCDDTLENDFLKFIGDGSEIYKSNICEVFSNASFVKTSLNCLNSYSLGLAGLAKFQINDFDEILPLYLKKPQAQRQLEEKLKD